MRQTLYQITKQAGAYDALRQGIAKFSRNDLFIILALSWVEQRRPDHIQNEDGIPYALGPCNRQRIPWRAECEERHDGCGEHRHRSRFWSAPLEWNEEYKESDDRHYCQDPMQKIDGDLCRRHVSLLRDRAVAPPTHVV
jgi:hypothetical protein